MRSTKKLRISYYLRIKNDICDFIQNELKQNINLYIQDQRETVLDENLINNLEKKITKNEITTKNEIIKKFLNNHIRENKSCNMV